VIQFKKQTQKIMKKRLSTFYEQLNLPVILTGTVILIGVFLSVRPLSAQEEVIGVLTEPFFNIGSDARVEGDLEAIQGIRVPSITVGDDFEGEITADGLTGPRSYRFPNLSGEVCLSAGNCDVTHEGTENRLVKFGPAGLTDSSIEDLSTEISMTISEEGNLGIGTDPEYSLHTAGRVQAGDDICTDLEGGVCLSEMLASLEEMDIDPDDLLQTAVEIYDGAGERGQIPVWRDDYRLDDSIIQQSANNIGIGTSPSQTLDVAGTARVLGFRMPVSPEEGYGLMSDERGVGTWRPVLTPRREEADIAERFPSKKGENLKPGELVSFSDKGAIKADKPYDKNLLGVVSTDPAMTLGDYLEEDDSTPIALIGRVPTKVSAEGGKISIGDLLTSSSKPGVAKKANGGGRVIGVALESFSGKSDTGKIEVFINPHEKTAPEEPKERLKMIDSETGDTYCMQIKNGELEKSSCD